MQTIHPIAFNSGLFYTDHGYTDEARFRCLFLEVWQALPFGHRRCLTCHWRQMKTAWLSYPGNGESDSDSYRSQWPCVEVLDSPTCLSSSLADALGCYCPAATRGVQPRLAFWSHAINQMPDPVVCALIAYALAEAYNSADGKVPSKPDWRYMLDRAELWDDAQNDGAAARQKMKDWGFSPSLLDTWIKANSAVIEAALPLSTAALR